MSVVRPLLPILLGVLFVGTARVQAQLTLPGTSTSGAAAPSRTVGGSLNAKTGNLFSTAAKPGAAAKPGVPPQTSTGGEWAIQRSHERGSFVGADARDKTGFVGASQSLMESGPGTGLGGLGSSGLTMPRVRFNTNINTPLPALSKKAMYLPRVATNFEYAAPSATDRGATLARQLQAAPSLGWKSPVEVSVAGQSATLRGEVASERDRALAEQMALFEPGIYEVRNLLTVRPLPIPPAPLPLPARKP